MMRSPSARASHQPLEHDMPQPSPRTKPSARASNALQRPSGAIMCAFERAIVTSGNRMRLTPPARASEHSPRRRLCTARCTATSDEEHAVSIERLGPGRRARRRGGPTRCCAPCPTRCRRPGPAVRRPEAAGSSPTSRRRGTLPVRLPASRSARCRHARAPPMRPRAAGAAAGPCPAPRAAMIPKKCGSKPSSPR